MPVKYILPILLLCSACYTGKIDCPKPKDVKLKKSNIKRSNQSAAARWVKAANSPETRTYRTNHYHYYTHTSKESSLRVVNNLSIEDWDCPKPGTRKYMPKQVQENIAANMARINDQLVDQADSSRTVSKVVLFDDRLLTHTVQPAPK
ncbi:MAG TPA: hypothetical protein VD816_18485 [Ohtaekwangia sp.]|nr:hypothetical protein [Ohtaekwangia sp.]